MAEHRSIQTPAELKDLQSKKQHLATMLGFQASLAAFLAMLVVYFTSLEQSSVIFLTAFLVIAGSTGESLRRMSLRVVGTVAGVVAGVILSFILTNLNAGSTTLIILIAVFMFLTAFFATTSYTWMIIWISIVVTLLVIELGGVPADVLIYRPLNTFIGASLAALVVVFVLPIRTRELFNNALSKFLNSLVRVPHRLYGKIKQPHAVIKSRCVNYAA